MNPTLHDVHRDTAMNQDMLTEAELQQVVDELLDEGLTQLSKPMVSEHAARQHDPSRYARFRRENDKFGAGIHVIWGILSDGKTEVQSVRFSASKFTVAEARQWLAEHDYKTGVEPATGTAKADAEAVAKVEDTVTTVTILKAEPERQLVYGVVYPTLAPGMTDVQGDRMDELEIMEAAHRFMLDSQRFDLQHQTDVPPEAVKIVESYLAPVDLHWQLPDGSVKDITRGSWIAVAKILDDKLWQLVKNGTITGYSIRGTGRRVPLT